MRSAAQPQTPLGPATSILPLGVLLALLTGLALTGCADKSAEAYIAQLSDPRQNVRLAATYNLLRMGQAGVMPLIHSATDGSDSLRYIACQILGQIGDRRAAPFLHRLTRASNIHVREKATEALGQLRDPEQGRNLEQLLAEDATPAVRGAAARGLGHLGDTTSVAPLIAALQDSVDLVRQHALASLVHLWTPSAESTTIAALRDRDETMRYIAAQMLGHRRTSRGIDELRFALLDTSLWVRTEAALALGQCGDTTAVSDLERLFSERVGPDHDAAQDALRQLTGMEQRTDSDKVGNVVND